MPDNALERLYSDMNRSEESQYSIDELMEAENNSSILDIMGNESKEYLMSKIQKVELDDFEPEKFEVQPIDNELEPKEPELEEELFEDLEQSQEIEEVQEVKRGRGRPRKEETVQVKDNDDEDKKLPVSISSLDKFMDSLARDLIQELRDKKYETRNFNREQMLVILDYLEKKI